MQPRHRYHDIIDENKAPELTKLLLEREAEIKREHETNEAQQPADKPSEPTPLSK